MSLYNVIFIDSRGKETALAERLGDRADAADLARKSAAERGVGRMVLPGSLRPSNCVCVVPVEDRRTR